MTFRPKPEDLHAMAEWIGREREGPFDIVMETGQGDENTPPDVVRGWRDAGATWWLEPVWWSMYKPPGDPTQMRKRIRQGPPKL